MEGKINFTPLSRGAKTEDLDYKRVNYEII